jgi:hypothetical protein
LAFAGFGLAALFAGLNIGFVGATNDTNTLMHYAFLWLSEGGLYTHWIQFNAPLAILMYVPPAAATVWLHLPEGETLHLYIATLCAFSVAVTYHALKGRVDKDERRCWLSAAAMTLLVVPEACFVYSDREHLLFIFALPWILQMLLGLRPRTYTTVLATLGFLLKPYNLIIFCRAPVAGWARQPIT